MTLRPFFGKLRRKFLRIALGRELFAQLIDFPNKISQLTDKIGQIDDKINQINEINDKFSRTDDKVNQIDDKISQLTEYIYTRDINDIARKINKRIKKDNRRNIIPVIIDCQCPQFSQHLEPIIEELLKIKEQKIDLFFGEKIAETGECYSSYIKENAFPVEIYQKLQGYMIFLSPRIHDTGPKSALRIIMGHGICSAKISIHTKEKYESFDIYCVTGKLNESKIKRNLEKLGLKDTVVNVGYPKSDKLYQGALPGRNDIFSRLHLDSRKKTLLYAPSWDHGLSLREFGTSLVDTILQNKDYNLIIKLHPNSFCSPQDNNYITLTGGINWEQEFSPFMNYPNCAFVKEFKIDELLTVSDIMITDLSSVALEFLALNKPVIYLDCPAFEENCNASPHVDISYSELLENPLCNAGRHVGLVNYNYKSIIDDINFLINNPDYKLKERQEYSEKILSNKGCASKVCANMMIERFKQYKAS
jgi:hypothetical protein